MRQIYVREKGKIFCEHDRSKVLIVSGNWNGEKVAIEM
jgi:hypothetical protein